MKEIVLSIAAIFGALAVIFGAFGAHALQKIMDSKQLKSFETGVKYQMYHAIVLLIIGFQFSFTSSYEKIIALFFSSGILLFSFSIYGLCLSTAKNKKLRFLGSITPIGGVLIVMGWLLLLYLFLKKIDL